MLLNESNSIPVFWRAKCRITGAEKTFRTRMGSLPSADEMRAWVADAFRDLDYIDHCPWDSPEHVGRVLYPVPKQHVLFNVKVPDTRAPERTRTSALITRAPVIRQAISKAPIVRRDSITAK